jgi:hypothetical protein
MNLLKGAVRHDPVQSMICGRRLKCTEFSLIRTKLQEIKHLQIKPFRQGFPSGIRRSLEMRICVPDQTGKTLHLCRISISPHEAEAGYCRRIPVHENGKQIFRQILTLILP